MFLISFVFQTLVSLFYSFSSSFFPSSVGSFSVRDAQHCSYLNTFFSIPSSNFSLCTTHFLISSTHETPIFSFSVRVSDLLSCLSFSFTIFFCSFLHTNSIAHQTHTQFLPFYSTFFLLSQLDNHYLCKRLINEQLALLSFHNTKTDFFFFFIFSSRNVLWLVFVFAEVLHTKLVRHKSVSV